MVPPRPRPRALSAVGLAAPLALAALMVLGVQAQPAPPPPAPAAQQAQQAPAPAPEAQPTFRSGVTAVSTDVIARDQNGRFVTTLTKDDFTVLEDGVPQTITSFAMVHGGRTFNLLAPPAVVGAPVPEGIVLPSGPRRAVQDVAGRVVVIFVDDIHFDAEISPHVKRIIEDLAANLLHDGDLVAMMSSGPSSIATGLTYDRKLVAASAAKIRGSGLTATEIFRNVETSRGPVGLRDRAQMAFYAAYGLLADLEQVQDKRKVLLYISNGYDFDPFAAGRSSSDRIQGGRFSDPLRFLTQDQSNPYFQLGTVTSDIDLFRYMRELTLAANRANVSIFTIDPRGLTGVVDAGQYVDQSDMRTHLQKTQSSLRYIAEQTGGFAVVNVNDFPAEFKRIDAETSDYYIIGFSSTNADPLKRVRQLEVTVRRPDVTVSARTAYSLKTPGKPPAPPPLKAPTRKR